MVVQPVARTITVERGTRGFGLSLIYRGLDKYPADETGIFVARVVTGGQAARYGVRENDKILTINAKTPKNVDDAVGVIKQAGNQIKLVVLREEEDNPSIVVDESVERSSLASGEMDSKWVSTSLMKILKYYLHSAFGVIFFVHHKECQNDMFYNILEHPIK